VRVSLETEMALAEGKPLPPSAPLILNSEQAYFGMEEFFKKILRLFKKKTEDYAKPTDGLHTPRQIAERQGISMPQALMTLIEKHIIALEGSSRNPSLALNEGVEDRLLDIASYCGLFYLALREKDITRRRTS
jgi:hypothetical protein